MAAVALLQSLLFLAWGDPQPIYDEAGYISAGETVAQWLRCGGSVQGLCAEATASSLGALLWHNPGYSALFVVAELLPGSAANWIRALQLVAGLLAGACVHRVLRPHTPPGIALAAAWVIWLYPVQLFFRVTLWPVAVATAAVAVVVLLAVRVHAEPSLRARLELSGGFLVLSLVYPMALAATPLLAVWLLQLGNRRGLGRRPAADVLAPTLGLWAGLIIMTSIALGTPSLGLLAGPENRALGNNPHIAQWRGSSLHDPASVQALRADVERGCPPAKPLSTLRCHAQSHRAIARDTVARAPGTAALRAGLRVVETWAPDEYVARHLSDSRVSTRWSFPASVPMLVRIAEVILLTGVLLLPLGGRDRRVRGLLIVVILCTAPIALGVGVTRLRQPLLPLIVLAAALTLARYNRPR